MNGIIFFVLFFIFSAGNAEEKVQISVALEFGRFNKRTGDDMVDRFSGNIGDKASKIEITDLGAVIINDEKSLETSNFDAIIEGELAIEVRNGSGSSLGLEIVEDPRILRMEVLSPDGDFGSSGVVYRKQATLFVDIPLSPDTVWLEISEPRFKSDGTYSLERIGLKEISPESIQMHLMAREFRDPGESAATVVEVMKHGEGKDKVDMIVLGDGYADGEQGLFTLHMNDVLEKFFAEEPFTEYRSYFNVYQVVLVSKQSGASHAGHQPIENALGSYYDCFGMPRLLCYDAKKLDAVLDNNVFPDGSVPLSKADIVTILVNDPEYGGSGGRAAISSAFPTNNPSELFLHELGHTFGKLGDEYSVGRCRLDASSQANISPKEAETGVKWKDWVGEDGIGMFEGANYCPKGLFRPSFNSKMRSLGRNFDAVSKEQLLKRIYTVAPLVIRFSPSTLETIPGKSALNISLTLQTPKSHSLTANWTLDDRVLGTGTKLSLSASDIGQGGELKALVQDETDMVRNDPNRLLKQELVWTIKPNKDSLIISPKTSKESSCSDAKPECGRWAKNGYCTRKYMKQNCGRSCKLC